MKNNILGAIALLTLSVAIPAAAQNHDHHHHVESKENGHHHHSGPAEPISMMGGHAHNKGEWMLSYRFMRMDMSGNRNGTDRLSPEEVITFANPFAPPSALRVVPTEMTMDMHMIGAMYAPTDNITLMAMGAYHDKTMDHITFNMAGSRIGTFTTNAKGFGDTKLSGLFRVYQDDMHSVHLNAGISLPTGSTDERGNVLTPMGMTANLKLPYAMQLGSGTLDALPGLTYSGHTGRYGWGAQYAGTLRIESENSDGYALGDEHMLTLWGGYRATDLLSLNAHIKGRYQAKIDGRDTAIAAPVQTADPANYGGRTVFAGAGFDFKIPTYESVSFAADLSLPIYRDLNGPQMETDLTGTAGLRLTF